MVLLQQIGGFIASPPGQVASFLFGGFAVGFIIWILKQAMKPLKAMGVLVERYKDYELSVVKFEDIERVHGIMARYVQEGVSPLQHWQERHRKNPNTLYMVERVSKKGKDETRSIQGVFSIIPVTREARDLISLNELNAQKFTPNHVCGPRYTYQCC
jgi:hypothetical protein